MDRKGWLLIILSICLIAAEKPADKSADKPKAKRHHGAHDHGVATVDIVLEAKAAAIEFRAPSESLFGFEHKPSSAEDKKAVETQTAKLHAEVDKLVKFSDALECESKVEQLETFVEEDHSGHDHAHDEESGKAAGEHTEVKAKIMVKCANEIANTQIGFGFSAVFPRINTIKVQLLSATTQVGKSITKDEGTISI